MMDIDLETVAGIAACAWALVAILGRANGWIKAHQEISAFLIAVAVWFLVHVGPGATLGGVWTEFRTGIIEIVIAVFGAGMAQDKLAKPLARLMKE